MMAVARVVVVIVIAHRDVIVPAAMMAPVGAIAAAVARRRPVTSIMLAPAVGTIPMRIPPMSRSVAVRLVAAWLVAALVPECRTMHGVATFGAVLRTRLLAVAVAVRVGYRTQQHSAQAYNRHPQGLRWTHGLLLRTRARSSPCVNTRRAALNAY